MKRLGLLLSILALPACQRPSEASRLPEEASRPVQVYANECDQGVAASCFALGLVYQLGDEENFQGVPRDVEHARELYHRACDGDHQPACDALAVMDE